MSCFLAAFTLVLFFARLYVEFHDYHFRLFRVYLFFASCFWFIINAKAEVCFSDHCFKCYCRVCSKFCSEIRKRCCQVWCKFGSSGSFIKFCLTVLHYFKCDVKHLSLRFLYELCCVFLAAIGVLTVVYDIWQKDFCFLVKCWFMISFFFFIFGNRIVHAWILYALPFHVLAVFGVIFFECWITRAFKDNVGRIFGALFALLFLLVNINYALRSMNTISMLRFLIKG